MDGDALFEERLVLSHLPPRDFPKGEETLVTPRGQSLGGIGYVLLDAAEIAALLIYEQYFHG